MFKNNFILYVEIKIFFCNKLIYLRILPKPKKVS